MKLPFAIKGILRPSPHKLSLQWRFLQRTVPQYQHPPPPIKPLDLPHNSFDSVQSISSHPSSFYLLRICKNINSLKKAHALLLVHGLTDDLLYITKLVSLYGSFGFVQCAHKETQFRFKNLSNFAEGVLARTYRPNYVSPVKRGVPMPIMGGEDKY
ncbi:hypothetical protein QN277_024146 [Acacia crassicarpa]|uniref:Uncharacterized protein n=1 Tax=Acacia crassicarpa TaxID=499986 RepID=A0AAE1JFZ3_9FABA|nr:hypothetical protein QN277_024146 [Acacia crassicarpa]